MSLDFQLRDIKNYEEICFVGTQPWGNGEKELSDVTRTLIWDTLVVGLGQVTEQNLDEWVYRLHIMDLAYPRELRITYQDLVNHIGLRTNASTITLAAFKKKAMNMLDSQAKRAVQKAKSAENLVG